MIESTLTIRYCPSRQHDTDAWFVPGSRPEQWLAELERWPVALGDVVLRPLPGAGDNTALAGVLVTAPNGERPTVSSHCQQYGRIAGRFFLPVEARCDPPVLVSELDELMFGNDDEFVFHPTSGLVRIGPQQRFSVADLLQPPPPADTDWNWAQPGNAPLRRLTAVEPDEFPSADEILPQAGDDIATEDPKQTPRWWSGNRSPRGSETGGGAVRRVVGGVFRGLVAGIAGLGAGLAGLGAGLAGIGRAAAGRPNDAVRDRQLDRLLKLLKDNPDEGLRYAMPLDGPAHRGSAQAGNELARRNVDFNLPRLFGGGPAGFWDVNQQRLERLRTQYRRLANREMSLGRYRRAAYVFAHLLGDMHAAAEALSNGGHWREAAALYRDRLKQPQMAAQCLEEGRCWSEAIDAYRQLENHEKVGDLYCQIGQDENAVEAYQRAVEKRVEASDYLDAARLAEQKLNSPDDALRYLAAGWPNSNQAKTCLDKMFSLHATHGQHEDAKKLIKQVDASFLSEHRAKSAVNILADVAARYPDPQVCRLAAGQVRIAAGQLLPDVANDQVREIVGDVRRLVPKDRLLGRDCQRYQESRGAASREKVSRIRVTGQEDMWWMVWSFSLPADVVWTTAARSQTAAYVAGYQENLLTIVRVPFSRSVEEQTVVTCPVSPGLSGAPVLLCPDPNEQYPLLVQALGDASGIFSTSFRRTDESPHERLARSGQLLTPSSRGAARSLDGQTWVVEQDDDELVLRSYGFGGRFSNSHAVPIPAEIAADTTLVTQYVPTAATHTHVYMAARDYLLCLKRGVRLEAVRLKSPIVDIIIPPNEYPTYILVRCESEIVALWHDATEHRLELLDDTMLGALCGCTRDDRVVLADGQRFEVFERKQRHFERTAKGVHKLESPTAIVTTQQPNQIMICCRDGHAEFVNLR